MAQNIFVKRFPRLRMADATLIVNGSTPIHLEPDTIYRIGRKAGVEIHIADQVGG